MPYHSPHSAGAVLVGVLVVAILVGVLVVVRGAILVGVLVGIEALHGPGRVAWRVHLFHCVAH